MFPLQLFHNHLDFLGCRLLHFGPNLLMVLCCFVRIMAILRPTAHSLTYTASCFSMVAPLAEKDR